VSRSGGTARRHVRGPDHSNTGVIALSLSVSPARLATRPPARETPTTPSQDFRVLTSTQVERDFEGARLVAGLAQLASAVGLGRVLPAG
jgi:hypothetical protein